MSSSIDLLFLIATSACVVVSLVASFRAATLRGSHGLHWSIVPSRKEVDPAMRRLRSKRDVLLVAVSGFFLLPTSGLAAESDIQLWPSLALNHGFGDHFGGHFIIRGRFTDDVSETKDYLLRPFVTWQPIHVLPLVRGPSEAGSGSRILRN